MRRVLVTGASGATGLAAVRALHGVDVQVRALVHSDDSRSDPLRELGAEIVTGDLLDIDSVAAAVVDVDAAYFVYPVQPGLIDATAYFAQAAVEAGVTALVNMSQRPARREAVSHASLNHWIAEQVFNRAEVPVTHLRSNMFADWMLYAGQVDRIKNANVLALPFADARFSPITAEDQGRVIAAILSDPSPHAGRVYYLNGPEVVTVSDIAVALSDVLGRAISYCPMPIADFQSIVTDIPHLGPFFAQHIGAVADDLRNGVFEVTNTTVADITGVAPMSIRDFVRLHFDEFAPCQPVSEVS
ncbi:NmrA family NAD(P)-binding protein [Mycobacterium sp. Aquia_216]|uniref:NmrA family NAD(P)-binding protein n=1 Tax=Mycobacterium sp. Aquia_216 TaxID=2991729 RepID=UPI00227C9C71|nr:NmrA family NAD(P)-binding protein [Mycobacterium sp. Aquia_216]WAJ44299.1 NmrA family NAD(P)-binding protein [Mycobacterium sp. Aquia_216]